MPRGGEKLKESEGTRESEGVQCASTAMHCGSGLKIATSVGLGRIEKG